jgi:hypothetical protein
MTYQGHIEKGVVVFDESVSLPDGTKVQVVLPPSGEAAEPKEESPTLYDRLKPFIGRAKGLPRDASVNHDHYLYGMPKK